MYVEVSLVIDKKIMKEIKFYSIYMYVKHEISRNRLREKVKTLKAVIDRPTQVLKIEHFSVQCRPQKECFDKCPIAVM